MHARAGEWERALPLLRSAVEEEPRWPEALRRMAAVDRMPADLVAEIESRLARAGRLTDRPSSRL